MAVMFFFDVKWNFDADEFMKMLLLRGDFKFKYVMCKSASDYALRVLNIEKLNQYLVEVLDDEFKNERDHVGYVAYTGYVKITKAMMDDHRYDNYLNLHDRERIIVRKVCAEEEAKNDFINLVAGIISVRGDM